MRASRRVQTFERYFYIGKNDTWATTKVQGAKLSELGYDRNESINFLLDVQEVMSVIKTLREKTELIEPIITSMFGPELEDYWIGPRTTVLCFRVRRGEVLQVRRKTPKRNEDGRRLMNTKFLEHARQERGIQKQTSSDDLTGKGRVRRIKSEPIIGISQGESESESDESHMVKGKMENMAMKVECVDRPETSSKKEMLNQKSRVSHPQKYLETSE